MANKKLVKKDSFRKYLSVKAFSASALKHIKNPEHFIYNINNPKKNRKKTDALKIGTLLHAYMEKGNIKDDVILLNPKNFPAYPDLSMRTKKNKFWFAEQEMKADMAGKYVIVDSKDTKDLMNQLDVMRSNILRLSINKLDEYGDIEKKMPLDKFLEFGEFETSHYCHHPEYGVKQKGRTDWKWKKAGIILDFKTTIDASPYRFKRELDKWRIDIQAGFYKPLCEYIDGVDYPHFYIVAVENEPPFHANLYRLDEDYVEFGRVTVDKRISKIVALLKKEKEPGMYDIYKQNESGIYELKLDSWRAGKLYNDEIEW